MMARQGFSCGYLDNFLVIAATYEACQLASFFKTLSSPITWHKVISPTQKLVFLGVELDTKNCPVTLPSCSKLTELQNIVSHLLTKRQANKRQLQQLAGKLNCACRVVYGGWTFLRRILDMMNSLRIQTPPAKARLSSEFFAGMHQVVALPGLFASF